MSARTVIAVDGGNSKTDVAILDETGRVLGTYRGPGASFTPDDHDRSVADLEQSVLAAAAEAGIDGRPVADAGVGEQAHRRVMVGVVSDQMAVQRDPAGALRVGGRPPALDEEGRSHAGRG